MPSTLTHWSETWHAPEAWLQVLEHRLRQSAARVRHGGDFDRWDLEVRGGLLGAVRLLTATEEHGAGRQLLRVRAVPRLTRAARLLVGPLLLLTLGAAVGGTASAALVLGCLAAGGLLHGGLDCAAAMGCARQAIRSLDGGGDDE